jgi:Holliday junction resolvase-like predicted endonuclease
MNNNEIIYKIEQEINNDIKFIVNKLDSEKLLLFLLIQQEIMFSTLEKEKHEYKETLSESFSYTINLIKHYKKIKLSKLQKYNITDYTNLKKEILDDLISLLLTKSKITDFKIYINKQGYKLNIENNILTITHEINNYIKYYKLGYLRSVIEDMYLATISTSNNTTNFIQVVQKSFERHIDFFKIMDKNSPIERISFLFSQPLCNILTNIKDNNSDYRVTSSFNNYFLNSDININDRCSKLTNIRWVDLLKFTIGISNISIFMDNTIKDQCINNNIMFNNSILFPTPDKLIFDVFKLLFNEINKDILDKDIERFIKKFTTDLTKSKINDKIDIQFKPIVKISDNFNFLLFRTFSATNLIRAYLSNHEFGLDEQGNKFEEIVKNTFLKRFDNVKSSLKFKNKDNEKGEIDICILGNNNIYFVECKNRLHPISASSATNNYEYIMKATKEQLPKAINYFNENRKLFIKKYFKKTIDNIEDFNIYKMIILSNRNVSGLNIDDVAIRDTYSLDRTLLVGYGNMGYVSSNDTLSFENNSKRIDFWENKTSFQEIDLINYLSEESIFFKFLENDVAIEQVREFKYKDYIFKDLVYAYEAYQKEEDNKIEERNE